MNWLDAFIVIIACLWCVVRSRRGALRVVMEFGSAALGLWVAIRFTDSATAAMASSWRVPSMVGWPIAFIVLVLAPTLVGQAVSEWLATARPARRAGGGDRLAGGLVGVAEVIVLAGFALVAFVEWGGQLSRPPLINSIVVGWLLQYIPRLYDWVAEVLTS